VKGPVALFALEWPCYSPFVHCRNHRKSSGLLSGCHSSRALGAAMSIAILAQQWQWALLRDGSGQRVCKDATCSSHPLGVLSVSAGAAARSFVGGSRGTGTLAAPLLRFCVASDRTAAAAHHSVVACFGTVVTVARVLLHCQWHSCLHNKEMTLRACWPWPGLLLLAAVAASLDLLILHLACNSNCSVHIKGLLRVLSPERSSM
jgi:hypothetical protein